MNENINIIEELTIYQNRLNILVDYICKKYFLQYTPSMPIEKNNSGLPWIGIITMLDVLPSACIYNDHLECQIYWNKKDNLFKIDVITPVFMNGTYMKKGNNLEKLFVEILLQVKNDTYNIVKYIDLINFINK